MHKNVNQTVYMNFNVAKTKINKKDIRARRTKHTISKKKRAKRIVKRNKWSCNTYEITYSGINYTINTE